MKNKINFLNNHIDNLMKEQQKVKKSLSFNHDTSVMFSKNMMYRKAMLKSKLNFLNIVKNLMKKDTEIIEYRFIEVSMNTDNLNLLLQIDKSFINFVLKSINVNLIENKIEDKSGFIMESIYKEIDMYKQVVKHADPTNAQVCKFKLEALEDLLKKVV